MVTIRVNNIPDDLHERLCEYAKKQNTTVDDLVLEGIARQIDHLDFSARIAAIKTRTFKTSPSELTARERAQRDATFDI